MLRYSKLLLCFFSVAITHVHGQEDKFISLYLYNFTKYVEWPDETRNGDFIIDIIGHKSVYESLKLLVEGKKTGIQDIVVHNYDTPEGVGKCHILFIGHWQSRFFGEILKKMEGSNTLIVTEKEGMIGSGTAINFIIRDNTIKFELKTTNITKYGLKVNSKLKEMAYTDYE